MSEVSIALKSNLAASYVSLGYTESIRKADFFALCSFCQGVVWINALIII